jgi:hypothetical protein
MFRGPTVRRFIFGAGQVGHHAQSLYSCSRVVVSTPFCVGVIGVAVTQHGEFSVYVSPSTVFPTTTRGSS